MKKILIVCFLISLFLVVGCTTLVNKINSVKDNSNIESPLDTGEQKNQGDQENNTNENGTILGSESPTQPGDIPECTVNADCTDYKQCIDRECGVVSQLYKTDDTCTKKCNFKNIKISSSSGDSYDLNRGQGSYTAAGAVEWKIVGGPNYCQEEKVLVPIQVIKKNTGKIVSKEVLTMHPGETTKVITHPSIKSVSFTLKIDTVDETCT